MCENSNVRGGKSPEAGPVSLLRGSVVSLRRMAGAEGAEPDEGQRVQTLTMLINVATNLLASTLYVK